MLKEIFQGIWDDQNGGLDQYQLRDKAFAAIERADYGDALYEALLSNAYAFILAQRGVKPEKAASTDRQKENRTSTVKKSAGAANSARSSKQASLREQWPMLRCSYSVAHGRRKNLESMSAEECKHAANVNRSLSDGNLRRAEWLEEIASELVNRNVGVVAKLPKAVLDDLQESAP
jgi:hypothetical protein